MAYIYESVQQKEWLSTNKAKLPATYDVNAINLANALTPGKTHGGDIDIINKFPWTLTPKSSIALKETPYIKLTEYYLLDSAINQLFKTYGLKFDSGIIGNSELQAILLLTFGIPNSTENRLYQGMYDYTTETADGNQASTETGFVYTFPYFSNTSTNTSNSWPEKNMYEEILAKQVFFAGGTLGGSVTVAAQIPGVKEFVPEAAGRVTKGLAESQAKITAKMAQLNLGLSSPVARTQGSDPALDVPKIWSTTAPYTFNISFPLFNILNESDIILNWELCHLLSYQNLFNKRNLFTGIPPVFYKIEIPGVYFSKAGYVSSLSIKNIGNIHNIPLTIDGKVTNVNIPDAYHIDMTITDFFIPSKNFLDTVTSKDKSKITSSAINLHTPEGTHTDPAKTLQKATGIQQAPILPNYIPGSNVPLNLLQQ